ncbi:hypothetical protein BS78_04G083900 [Paspalum vaginatum]|nr:hypothetical protein BS78_04G083900 [Paspalum vaginatum]
MNSKAMATPILFAMLLGCVVFLAYGENNNGRSDDGHLVPKDVVTSRKILCVRSYCPDIGTCYCCQGIPDVPCYQELRVCRSICTTSPAGRELPIPRLRHSRSIFY